tara:strand:+ start:204 stop:611 length:408 start_codon:yes stop_codon:yes gene_type:complete
MFKQKKPRRKAQLTLAPMLDMIFILLIFFVVSTTFSKLPGIKINKPDATQTDQLPPNNLMIGISSQGSFVINQNTYSVTQIKEKLTIKFQNNPNLSVLIIADELSALKYTIQIMDLCKQVGIKSIAIAEEKIDAT